jgi:hypothetical protein
VLAATGFTGGELAGLGALLVLAGTGVYVVTRRVLTGHRTAA